MLSSVLGGRTSSGQPMGLYDPDGDKQAARDKRLLHYAPIADRISRDRFEEITRYLHFVDNDILPARGEEGFSLLQKVEPVISHLKAKFKSVYYPHCQCSIDEAMIPFKGQSSMKQYLPLKPVGYGRLFERSGKR